MFLGDIQDGGHCIEQGSPESSSFLRLAAGRWSEVLLDGQTTAGHHFFFGPRPESSAFRKGRGKAENQRLVKRRHPNLLVVVHIRFHLRPDAARAAVRHYAGYLEDERNRLPKFNSDVDGSVGLAV